MPYSPDPETLKRIAGAITGRPENLFKADISANENQIRSAIEGRSVLVIGGAGSVGTAFIHALIPFSPARIDLIDTNENGLAELIRDLRSTGFPNLPSLKTWPLDFGSEVFFKLVERQKPYDIVTNFAALKHVRSEKDRFGIQAMFENNLFKAARLLTWLRENPPERFFCVSSDKAAAPANFLGATKYLMERLILSAKNDFQTNTARFGNILFSAGSLTESYIYRFSKRQPLVCPLGTKRFFLTEEEAGALCLLAAFAIKSGDITIPRLPESENLKPFTVAAEKFLEDFGYKPDPCRNEMEALQKSRQFDPQFSDAYPVLYTPADTPGEKPFEQFFTENETVDMEFFKAAGVIQGNSVEAEQMDYILDELRKIIDLKWEESALIELLSKHVPGFSFQKGTGSLDDKM